MSISEAIAAALGRTDVSDWPVMVVLSVSVKVDVVKHQKRVDSQSSGQSGSAMGWFLATMLSIFRLAENVLKNTGLMQ